LAKDLTLRSVRSFAVFAGAGLLPVVDAGELMLS
jgi:hypothetical protein